MYWHCEICDNIMIEEMKNKYLESKFFISFVNSIIRDILYLTHSPKKLKIQ